MKALFAILLLMVAVSINDKVNEFESLKKELGDLISKVNSLEKETAVLKLKVEELTKYENKANLSLKFEKLRENVTLLKDELKDLKDKNSLIFYIPLCIAGFTGGLLLGYGISELLRRR
jgi:chromosome segregation ATPase